MTSQPPSRKLAKKILNTNRQNRSLNKCYTKRLSLNICKVFYAHGTHEPVWNLKCLDNFNCKKQKGRKKNWNCKLTRPNSVLLLWSCALVISDYVLCTNILIEIYLAFDFVHLAVETLHCTYNRAYTNMYENVGLSVSFGLYIIILFC